MFSLFTVVKKDDRLEEENKKLKAEVEELRKLLKSRSTTRVDKLKEVLSTIPDGAKGKGSILVYENDEYKALEFESKQELVSIVNRAESGQLEIVFV